MRRSTLLFGTLALTIATSGAAIGQQPNLPDGPNRDFVSRACQECHDLSMVFAAAGLTRDGWDATIEEMVSYGLRVTPDERAKLLEYLSTYLATPP
jgi:hypothetical protein